MILVISSTCSDPVLANILSTVKAILLLIQIIVPIMLIVWGSYGIFQMMMDPDQKNGIKNIINKFIAAIVVFMIPVFINVCMYLVGESTTFSDCWNKASSYEVDTTYDPSDDVDNRKPIVNSNNN